MSEQGKARPGGHLWPLMSSENVHWCTPPEVLELVRAVAPIGLDPCSNPGSIVGAREAWSIWAQEPSRSPYQTRDGLLSPWAGHGLIYVNWPYSRQDTPRWARKVAHEGRRLQGADSIIALCAARTSEQWFRHVWTADAICFWSGRLKFLGAEHGATFSSVLPYWGRDYERFCEVFSEHGRIILPWLSAKPG